MATTKRKQQARRTGQIIARGTRQWLVRAHAGGGKYPSKLVKGTHREAEAVLRELQTEIHAGTHVVKARQSVQAFVERWLDTEKRIELATRTVEGYRWLMEQYVFPAVGSTTLDELKQADIQGIVGAMHTRKLSPATIRGTIVILKSALQRAVDTRVIRWNPAAMVVLPRRVRTERQVLDRKQVALFLETTSGDPLHVLWNVLFNCGLRPAEAYGLQWKDLEGDRIHIQRALVKRTGYRFELDNPKTERSRRAVALPKSTIAALTIHKATQAREKLKRGGKYARHGFIFANSRGRPLSHANVTKHFKAALVKAGLPKMRMYDTRHTHATGLLHSGANLKVVSERLGHSSIVLTADTYSHVSPQMQRESIAQYECFMMA